VAAAGRSLSTPTSLLMQLRRVCDGVILYSGRTAAIAKFRNGPWSLSVPALFPPQVCICRVEGSTLPPRAFNLISLLSSVGVLWSLNRLGQTSKGGLVPGRSRQGLATGCANPAPLNRGGTSTQSAAALVAGQFRMSETDSNRPGDELQLTAGETLDGSERPLEALSALRQLALPFSMASSNRENWSFFINSLVSCRSTEMDEGDALARQSCKIRSTSTIRLCR